MYTPSRAQVSALTPEARSEAAIHAAVAVCDYVQAAAIILARALAGEPVAATTIATVLPGLRDEALGLALLGLGGGDRAAAWLHVVESGAFPQLSTIGDVEAMTLYAAWKEGAERAGLVKQVRRLSRYAFSFLGSVLLDAMVQALAEPNLTAAAASLRAYGDTPEGARELRAYEKLRARSVEAYVATLPAETALSQAPIGLTVRAPVRVGRNEACPCGSGQKYKRCCADKDAQIAPSPVAGMSWDDFVTTAADRMTVDDVLELSLRDLARVDLTGLGLDALVTVLRRFAGEREWKRAATVLEALALRPAEYEGIVDDHRTDVIAQALEAGQLDFAEEQLAKVTDEEMGRLARLEIAVRRGAREAFEMLVAMIETAVREERNTALVDLADVLLRAAPALGIVLARSSLRHAHPLDREALLQAIEDARDDLGLAAGDPAWEETEAGEPDDEDDDEDHAAAVAEAGALRSSLRETADRVEELERQLKSHQDRLAAKPERVAAVPPDREAERRLRMKIEELQGLVREGNTERGELRRQLIAVSAGARAHEPGEATREEDEGEDIAESERQVAVPDLSRRFLDSLEAVPQTVAAEAMRAIGGLAAGDHAAWRGVKAARDMTRQVLMRRIGIHHRMLFRAEARTLEVMDLITRENLLTTLKRLR